MKQIEPKGSKILIDLSDDPVRENQLISVLRDMVKIAMAKNARESALDNDDSISCDPEYELTGVEDIAIL